MVKINREDLKSGAFLAAFQGAPGIEWWSEDRIEASMRDLLARRPRDEPVWLFAYGSLLWNPVFQFVESCPAVLEGWRRSFCIRLVIARGTTDHPGRMMSLVTGGQTAGLAHRLDEAHLEQELRLVWMREMVGGAYRPDWATVALADGRSVQALIFTADPTSALHEADDSIDTIAPIIGAAYGPLGSNRDYVLQLNGALSKNGFNDCYVPALAERLSPELPWRL